MTISSNLATSWKGIGSITLLDTQVTYSNDLVEVPYHLGDGRRWNTRVIAPDGRRWWRPKGRSVIPFGLEFLPSPVRTDDILVICEGESDVLALRDAITMLGSSRMYVIGVPGAGTWKSEWTNHVRRFPTVYVAGDGDAAGVQMISSVIADLPWARPVWLPAGGDVRSLVQANPDEIVRLLDEADEAALRHAALSYASTADQYLRMVGGGVDA